MPLPLKQGDVVGVDRDGYPYPGHEMRDALDRHVHLGKEGRGSDHKHANLPASDVIHVGLLVRSQRFLLAVTPATTENGQKWGAVAQYRPFSFAKGKGGGA